MKLAVCILFSLAALARCAVTPIRPTVVPGDSVQQGTHSSQGDIIQHVAGEIVGEKLNEVGAVAQKTGHVLYKLGSELLRALPGHDVNEQNATKIGFFQGVVARITSAVKHAANVAYEKAKKTVRDAVIGMVSEIIEAKLRSLVGLHALNESHSTYTDVISQFSRNVEVLGEQLVKKGVELSGGVAVDVDLTDDQIKFIEEVVEALRESRKQ